MVNRHIWLSLATLLLAVAFVWGWTILTSDGDSDILQHALGKHRIGVDPIR